MLAAAGALVGAQKARQWKTGTLVDSSASTRTETMSLPMGADLSRTWKYPVTVKETDLVIQGDDFKYTAREITGARNGCHYIVNDPVQYRKEKEKLYVRDADGRECRLLILREERIAPPASPQQGVQQAAK